MPKSTGTRYTEEFKVEAVQLVCSSRIGPSVSSPTS
jgi:transposase-like protein